MIKVNNIRKVYDSDVVFDGITFSIRTGEKVALLGRNGVGKSTILKIIAGLETVDLGNIFIGQSISYLKQEFEPYPDIMVGEYMERLSAENYDYWYIESLLGKLGFQRDIFTYIDNLSGGERMRLELATLLYSNGEDSTILMDEPTNHLDIVGIGWLEKFINKYKGTILFITHDRELINRCADRIIELDDGKAISYNGNYDYYILEKESYIENRRLEYNRFMERKKRLDELLEKARRGIIRSRSGNATESIKKKIEREVIKNSVSQYESVTYQSISIESDAYRNKLILRLDSLSLSYAEKEVLKDINLEIRGTEKIWLMGRNGAGKSSLIKCILGIEKDYSGTVKIGESVKIGYFAQKLSPLVDKTILSAYLEKNTSVSHYSIQKLADKYLFSDELMKKPICLLSPGQQARVQFAIFAEKSKDEKYNFLILDEPGQHLDIMTKEMIESVLNEYGGAMLIVSHDLYAMSRLDIDNIISLEEGVIKNMGVGGFEPPTTAL